MPIYASSIVDNQVLAAVKSFLIANIVGPTGWEIRGDVQNRVPMPNTNYIIMNHLSKSRISTNQTSYSDTTETMITPTKYGIQLDVVSPNGGDVAEAIEAVWFSSDAADVFAAYGFAPLYTGDPKHAPWVNGENQWESRWVIEVYLQYNPAFVIAASTFDEVPVVLVEDACIDYGVGSFVYGTPMPNQTGRFILNNILPLPISQAGLGRFLFEVAS